MNPRNKKELHIIELSSKLRPLTKKNIQEGSNKCFRKFGWRTKKGGTYCTECGHNFHTDKKIDVCPSCKKKLFISDTRKEKDSIDDYISMLDVKEHYQIVRNFAIRKYYSKGGKCTIWHSECSQVWIDTSNGEMTLLAISKASFGNGFIFGSKLSIKDLSSYNSHVPGAENISNRKLHPIVKRNGYVRVKEYWDMGYLIHKILSDNKYETIIKSNFKEFLSMNSYEINYRWFIIKSCIKNNYHPSNLKLYMDYIIMLDNNDFDIKNPKYLFPKDLKAAHDDLISYQLIKTRRRNLEQRREKAIDKTKGIEDFYKNKSKFFDLRLSDGLLDIIVLSSIDMYYEEGKTLNHCVFKSDYYMRNDTLILSARINNEPVETIELSLETFKVVQCHGINNTNSEYHDRILNLVNKNTKLFENTSIKGVNKYDIHLLTNELNKYVETYPF